MQSTRFAEPAFARYLLRNHADIGHEPLCVLLYFLDALALLRSGLQPSATRSYQVSDRRPSLATQSSDCSNDSRDTARPVDDISWRDWLSYVQEAYLLSAAKVESSWRSPFAIPADIGSGLAPYLSSAASTSLRATCGQTEQRAVLLTCRAALAYLQSQTDTLASFQRESPVLHGMLEAESGNEQLLQLLESPLPRLDASLQATIRDALNDIRQAHTGEPVSVDQLAHRHSSTFRWLLSSLLEHHVGPSHFGQTRDGHGSPVFAADSLDNEAIRSFFPSMSEESDSFADGEDSPTLQPGSIAAARVAHLRQQKRDAKLRAFFGEPVNTRRFSDSHSLHHRLTQSESLSSLGSNGPESPTGRRRAWSGSSSVATSMQLSPLHRRLQHSSSSVGHDGESSLARSSASYTYANSVMSFNSGQPLLGRTSESHEYTRKAPAPLNIPPAGPRKSEPPVQPVLDEDRPFSDCLEIIHDDTPMPLTANELSLNQRRDLVKRSRKLQSMLGATLDESAAQFTLVDKVRPAHANASDPPPVSPTLCLSDASDRASRRFSYPPPSPTSPFKRSSATSLRAPVEVARDEGLLSPQTSMSRSSSSDGAALTSEMTSPETGLETPNEYDASEPWGHALYGLGLDPEAKAKEERRRRVAKLQRFLGERIPVELAFAPPPPTFSHKRAPSKLGHAFQRASSRLGIRSRSSSAKSTSEEEQRSSEEAEERSAIRNSMLAGPRRAPPVTGPLSSEQTIASIRKARKLEQVFGELPPPDMYRANVPRTSTTTRASSDSDDNDAMDEAEDARRRSHRISSVSGRRESVKALLHLHEHDPAALDDLAQALGGQDERPDSAMVEGDDKDLIARLSGYTVTSATRTSTSYVPSTATQSAFDPEGEPISPFSMTSSDRNSVPNRLSLSSDGHRHYARAAKLASIFGTTKGAVLRQVLEDLEADLDDDSETSETERNEIRTGLSRLRAEALS